MLRFLLQRKIIVGLGIVFIFIAGIYGIKQIDKELFPDVSFNQTIIMLQTEEMPAEDVEQLVTIPVEQALEEIDGVINYDSFSTIGTSTIMVELKENDSESITREIESNIAELKEELYGVNDSIVMQASTSNEFEMFVDISGASDQEMENLAVDIVQPRLEALPEVGKVEISGLKHPQIEITPNERKLEEYDLQEHDMITAIEQANQSNSLGMLEKEVNSPALRMQSTLKHTDDIENIQLATPQETITLADIADISTEEKSDSVQAWKNGDTDFLVVQIGRANNVGQIAMTDAVRDELKKIDQETDHPAIIHEIAAQGDYVDEAIDGIVENIIIGGIIAIIVLLLFLRNIRATIIIGLSIPASILLTILTMTLLDYSFNLLSLIGLGLGIGMLVDASIVVLESIFKKKEIGYNKLDAVLIGTKEVAGAVIASMLTTIVVFVPIILLDDDVGKMILILTVVIAVTLISSVVIAFTLIPVLSENFLRVKAKRTPRFHIIDKYGGILTWLTQKKRRRIGILVLFLMIFVGSFFLITKIPTNFMPDILNRYAEVAVELESGTTPQERDALAKEINTELEDIQDVESNVILDNTEHMALLINMTPEEEKTVEQTEINEEIFDRLRALEDDTPIRSISSMMEGVGGNQVELHIEGEDMAELEKIGGGIVKELEQINEVSSANIDMGEVQNELLIQIDEDKANEDGLTPSLLQHAISHLFQEQNIGEVTIDNESLPMFIKHAATINDKKTLLQEEIPTENGENPLSDYISLKKEQSFTQIDRENGSRYISVVADVKGDDLGSLHQQINQIIADFDMQDGYSAELAGDMEEQQQAATELIVIFAISLFLVFVVMAIQLNSLKFPLIILCIIPVTITGVILGLFITQKELNILSAIGVIMLIGIVINNGILLIDRARQLRVEGYQSYDAIVLAGKERIRPIFMTTLTTVGGMQPLALATGASSDYQSPLAVVIISGLIFSTLITLILIPSLYLILEDLNRGVNKVFKRKKPHKTEKDTRLSS